MVFSEKAYLSILAETFEKIKTETGGIFLGCFENDTFYVVEAIDPGPKSTFQVAYFEYDQKYTQHLINKIARLYNAELTLIGLWHRHPGSFDQFSSTDDGTNRKYAQLHKNGAISVLVNIDPEFRITPYHVGNPLKYSRIAYEVGDDKIPENIRKMKTIDSMRDSVNGYLRRRNAVGSSSAEKLNVLLNSIKPKMSKFDFSTVEQETVQTDISAVKDFLIDSLLDDISFLTDIKGLELSIEPNDKYISVSQNGVSDKVYFTYVTATKQIIFSYCEICYLYSPGLFEKLLNEVDSGTNEKSEREVSLKNNILKVLGIGNTEE